MLLSNWLWRLLTCTVLCLVAQLCLTLCDPVDCSPPGSSVHGDSPGEDTGVGWHALLQGIFPTQGLNQGLPHCKWILYRLSHQRSPGILECSCYSNRPQRKCYCWFGLLSSWFMNYFQWFIWTNTFCFFKCASILMGINKWDFKEYWLCQSLWLCGSQ